MIQGASCSSDDLIHIHSFPLMAWSSSAVFLTLHLIPLVVFSCGSDELISIGAVLIWTVKVDVNSSVTTKPYHSAFHKRDTPTWRKSAKGNKYIMIGDKPLTVFQQKSGSWVYVIDGDFSNEWNSELDAMASAEEYWRYTRQTT